MKPLCILLFAVSITTNCFAQFQKPITFRATANFNVVLQGLGVNEAGAGLGLETSFFSTKRLQVIIEANADRFIGDKQLLTDSLLGKTAKNAAVYTIKLGPQLFLTSNIAIAATYGPSWHIVRAFNYTLDDGLNYSVTGFWGPQKRFVTKGFVVNIPAEEQKIRYMGLAAGYRF